MSLTLRNVKGSPLTYTEMDNNLTYLEGLGTSGTTQDLSNVLFNGNTTSGNNIILSIGDKIIDNTSNNFFEFTNLIAEGGVLTTDSTGPNPGPGASYIISPNSTSGVGTGLVVRMNRNTSDNSFGIQSIQTRGSGYQTGDTITFLGTQYGLTSPADDVTYTILTVTNEVNNILVESTDGTFTSNLTIDSGFYNSTNGDGNNYTSIYGDAGTVNLNVSDDIIALYTGLELDPQINNAGTRFYFDDQTNGIYSSFAFDLSGNLLLNCTDTVDTTEIELRPNNIRITGLPTYADNAAAISGGLTTDDVYKTSTGELRIVI